MSSNRHGLIGEKLGHSFSPIIHKQLADYDYQLYSIPRDEIDAFMKKRDFAALNVTIPYKQTVMPYCDIVTDVAKKIGCVNTLVVRPDGKLLGDNTDYSGFLSMAKKAGVDFNGKKVLILGSGGTSLTARTAAADSGAKEVHIRTGCPPVLFGCKYLNFTRSSSEMELITRRVIVELEGKEPDRETLMAYVDPDNPKYKAMVERIRQKLNFTSLAYLRLDDMLASTGVDPEKLCTYCWNGKE